jgi:hypothetical protein
LEPTELNLKVSPTVFAGSTNISFDLPSSTDKAFLQVVNSAGQSIWTRSVDKGITNIAFDAPVPSGSYFLTLYVNGQQTKALQMTKVD